MPPTQLNDAVYNRFMALPQGTRITAEYIWIGGSGLDLRSKTRTLEKRPSSVDELPEWNFDGSSAASGVASPQFPSLRGVAPVVFMYRGWSYETTHQLRLCRNRVQSKQSRSSTAAGDARLVSETETEPGTEHRAWQPRVAIQLPNSKGEGEFGV